MHIFNVHLRPEWTTAYSLDKILTSKKNKRKYIKNYIIQQLHTFRPLGTSLTRVHLKIYYSDPLSGVSHQRHPLIVIPVCLAKCTPWINSPNCVSGGGILTFLVFISTGPGNPRSPNAYAFLWRAISPSPRKRLAGMQGKNGDETYYTLTVL